MTKPDPDREIAFARAKARHTLPVALLVLLGLVAMYLPLPKRFVAFVPLLVAIVLTVRLLRFLAGRASREKVWPVVTLVVIGMLVSTLLVQIAFYGPVSRYEQCVAGAQTSVAQADCQNLRDAGLMGGLLG